MALTVVKFTKELYALCTYLINLEKDDTSKRSHTRCGRDWSSVVTFFVPSRRRHTRCGRDWSSDVCSSDLEADLERRLGGHGPHDERITLHEERPVAHVPGAERERPEVAVEVDVGHGGQREVERAVDVGAAVLADVGPCDGAHLVYAERGPRPGHPLDVGRLDLLH